MAGEGQAAAGVEDDKGFQLRDVNLRIKPGELVMVVGRVGSGKSSLVNALLGEMEQSSGHLRRGGSLAYVA